MSEQPVDGATEDRENGGPDRAHPSGSSHAPTGMVARGRRLLQGRRSGLRHGQEPLAPEDQADLAAADPGTLRASLESSDRFRRDTGLGAIYHPGKLSFREVRPTDSLHIIIDGDRISAHIDDISPFKRRADGTVRYSLSRIVAHNLAGMSSDLLRLARGRVGRQRCKLECERVWVDDEPLSEVADAPDRPPRAPGSVSDLVSGRPAPTRVLREEALERGTPPG